MKKLTDKVALVAGVGRGLGWSLRQARKLCQGSGILATDLSDYVTGQCISVCDGVAI